MAVSVEYNGLEGALSEPLGCQPRVPVDGAKAVPGPGQVEVGWAVWPVRWGQGYATELGAAAVGYGFDELQLHTIVAYTLVDNRASRRVMEKLGFEYERDVTHANLPHVLYRCSPAVG